LFAQAGQVTRECVVGDGIFFGAIALLGGLAFKYMKAHPFYRYKTQKFKDQYQHQLHHALSAQYGETKGYWIARALTDYIFDFGRRIYSDYHVEQHAGLAQEEKHHLNKYRIEVPEALCDQLVQRAVELQVPQLRFQNHIKELSDLLIVPVGQLTPGSVNRIAHAEVYIAELTKMRLTQAQMKFFIEKNS